MHFPVWATVLSQLPLGSKQIRILEIGSWEGRSALWFLQNIPGSHITCIDTFEGGEEHNVNSEFRDLLPGLYERFCENTKEFKERMTVLRGKSSDMLFTCEPDSFDVIYVDGSHHAWDAMSDIVMSWHLLKNDGIMIIDDYGSNASLQDSRKVSPRLAVETFLYLYEGQYKRAELGPGEWQVFVYK